MALIDDIIAATAKPRLQPVVCADLGLTLFIKKIPFGEYERYERLTEKNTNKTIQNIISMCCDADGKLIFDESHIPMLEKLTLDDVNLIMDGILAIDKEPAKN